MRFLLVSVLLMPQVFTETITPKNGECVRVVFKGVLWIAQSADRQRLTGRVALKMHGRTLAAPTVGTAMEQCRLGCVATHARNNPCIAACWVRPEQERVMCSRECELTAPPKKEEPRRGFLGVRERAPRQIQQRPFLECAGACMNQPAVASAAPAVSEGRTIDLAGADVLTTGTCSCEGVQKCVFR